MSNSQIISKLNQAKYVIKYTEVSDFMGSYMDVYISYNGNGPNIYIGGCHDTNLSNIKFIWNYNTFEDFKLASGSVISKSTWDESWNMLYILDAFTGNMPVFKLNACNWVLS